MSLADLIKKLSERGVVCFDVAHDEHRARFRPITVRESVEFAKYELGVLVERKRGLRRDGKPIDPDFQNVPDSFDEFVTKPFGVMVASDGTLVCAVNDEDRAICFDCQTCIDLGAKAVTNWRKNNSLSPLP